MCAARPPARALPGPSRDGCDALSLHHSRRLHPPFRRPRPPRPAPLTTRAALAQATPREMYGCGRRRCSTTAHVGRTDVEHAAADTTAVGRRLRSNASAAAPAPALGLDAPARTASDIPPAAVVLPPATPPDAGARAAPRSSHTPGGGSTRRRAPSLARSRCPPELECPDVEFVCRTILEPNH